MRKSKYKIQDPPRLRISDTGIQDPESFWDPDTCLSGICVKDLGTGALPFFRYPGQLRGWQGRPGIPAKVGVAIGIRMGVADVGWVGGHAISHPAYLPNVNITFVGVA